jgi:hypothetical protein
MDPTAFADQRDDVRLRLTAQRAQELLQSILNERRRDTVVTVNNQLMERFSPAS